ncbi:amidohydrolase family protein [Devosia faecipullorum]|uniref:amidohydrolase family protein n=1 Tax=Devosia faecipullorum TaxID=2755039 RepID=UPI00187B632B|nr:amidohydrolase family protein [Devosia faecipullorum]MBE7734586.1 amidohydrolase family protein [Devosia faecipullorum]
MLKVVDPHVHLWDLRTGLYPHFEIPGPGGLDPSICRNYLLDEYLAEGDDDVQVVGAVHVEAFPTSPLGEAHMIQAVAAKGALPLVLVSNADLRASDLDQKLDLLGSVPVLRGIRQIINGPAANQSLGLEDDRAFLQGLRTLGQQELSFDLQLWPAQMERAAALAAASPETMFVINHAGLWNQTTRTGWSQWRTGLRKLASRDNVKIKISGLGMFDPGWTVQGIAPIVFDILEAFGTRRTMFASNFPVDKVHSRFTTIWRAFDTLTEDLSTDERDNLFRLNAIETYRIPGAAVL